MNATLCFMPIAIVLSACARTPDVTYKYYPARSSSTISIVQVIDCSADKTRLFTVEAPKLETTYSADFTKPPHTIPIKNLSGLFADSDIKLIRTEDGRLQSIDQWTVGQGTAIIKSVVSLVAAGAALGGGGPPALTPLPECQTVAAFGGGKPVALTYAKTIDLSSSSQNDIIKMNESPSIKGLYDALSAQLPVLDVKITRVAIDPISASPTSNEVHVTLQNTASMQLTFRKSGSTFAESSTVIPTNESYDIPVPRAALFGKQSLSLVVAPSGAVTTIQYGMLSGASGAADAATAILQTPMKIDQEIAANAKAEADAIAQLQRVVRCNAQPESCT